MSIIASISLTDIVFVIIAAVTVLAALGVVISKNIVHSALFLVLAFLGVAGIYFQLGAGFIGLVQIMVYAGAISVLFIFAVMMVMDKDVKETNLNNPKLGHNLIGAYVVGLLTVILAGSIAFTKWPVVSAKLPEDAVSMIAEGLMGDYVVAFEVAAILLLIAVVGAIVLAKGADKE